VLGPPRWLPDDRDSLLFVARYGCLVCVARTAPFRRRGACSVGGFSANRGRAGTAAPDEMRRVRGVPLAALCGSEPGADNGFVATMKQDCSDSPKPSEHGIDRRRGACALTSEAVMHGRLLLRSSSRRLGGGRRAIADDCLWAIVSAPAVGVIVSLDTSDSILSKRSVISRSAADVCWDAATQLTRQGARCCICG
jgi:hypothetical protein